MCRGPAQPCTVPGKEFLFNLFSFQKRKKRNEVKLVFPNNGKDLVFLMTGRAFVDGEGEGCCLGLRGFGLLKATPVLEWSSRYPPPDFFCPKLL